MTSGVPPPPHQLASALAVPGFEAIYREHFDFVWRVSARLGVHTAALEDATHDTFVVVHRLLPGFEGRSSIRTWLYSIARKTASEYRRLESRQNAALVSDAPSTAPSPEEAATDSQHIAILDRLLDALSPEKREAFVLIEIESMSVVEAAEATGVNVNTMYARIGAARRELAAAVAAAQNPPAKARRGAP